MNQIHSSPTPPIVTTQASVPSEVVPGGERIKTEEFVRPSGNDQAQPACFGGGKLQIPERSESDRLCSVCLSLGRLNSTHWHDIAHTSGVVINHHHSFHALVKSAREGCHLCGLLLIAWEEEYRLEQEPGRGWVGKAQYDSASLNEGIKLKFERLDTTIPLNGGMIDEVRITSLCGEFLGGRLICKAMDSERSSSLRRFQFHAINQWNR